MKTAQTSWRALFTVRAAAPAPPVVVSALTTAQLAATCEGEGTDARATFCTGYILGVFDTLSRAHAICPAADRASTGAVVATTVRYLRKHRRTWTSAPSFVVRDALAAAFPCPRRPG